MRCLAILLVVVAACNGGARANSADAWAAPGPREVGVRTVTLVDASRSTPANGDAPALPTRTLEVEIWYPAIKKEGGTVDAPARDATPVSKMSPVIVFAHGFMGSRVDHALLGATIASHGWVFVAPEFPLSAWGAKGGSSVMDILGQADDMRFVLDRVLAADGDTAWLAGIADGDHVAFGGMSLGGTTALLASLYAPTRDTRVDAILAVAPASCMLPVHSLDGDEPPVLFVHGDMDAFVPLAENSARAYDAFDPPKAMVTLRGGTHAGFPDVSATWFEMVPNADTIGCAAAGGKLAENDPTGFRAMFPPGTASLSETCPTPCVSDRPWTSMRSLRQGVLLRASAVAFLEAVFDEDKRAARWLSSGLAEAESDVTVDAQGFEQAKALDAPGTAAAAEAPPSR